MAKLTIQVDTIFDGFMPSALYGQKDEFQAAIGIDPDLPMTDDEDDVRTGGAIRPVNYPKFSGAVVNSHPIAILSTPKDNYIYAILSNGKIIRYNSDFSSETSIGQTSTSQARGAWYYNNYIYITTGTDVSRYGPLDGTPALTNGVWTSATLGTLTALTDTSYPTTLLSVAYLNHFGVVHVDGASYFLDFKNGVGMVHKIQTSKVTSEGDTNNGSAYNILDLPANYLPISISPYGNDLVVSASFTKNGDISQGKAALFFFNPSDSVPSFYRIVTLPDTICSALKYGNGSLKGLCGSTNGKGYRLFEYVGGETIQTLKYIEDGYPPLQGAIDSIANRLAWAADTEDPMVASGLYAYGSKSDLFPRGLHHIATTIF